MDGCEHSKSSWPVGFTNPEKLLFASHKAEQAQNFALVKWLTLITKLISDTYKKMDFII